MVAGIAQAESIVALTDRNILSVFLTAMALALVATVLAAFWKHEYKKWHVKAQESKEEGREAEVEPRQRKARRDLMLMRGAMVIGVVLVVGGVLSVAWAVWQSSG